MINMWPRGKKYFIVLTSSFRFSDEIGHDLVTEFVNGNVVVVLLSVCYRMPERRLANISMNQKNKNCFMFYFSESTLIDVFLNARREFNKQTATLMINELAINPNIASSSLKV